MENKQNSKSVSDDGDAGEHQKPNSDNGDHFLEPNPDRSHDQEPPRESADGSLETSQPPRPSRTPFTNLSQVDADLALARTLQEQERAYMMLRMNNDGSDYGSWEAGSYLPDDEEDDFNDFHDETEGDEDDDHEGTDAENSDVDAFDANDLDNNDAEDNNATLEFDPSVYSSDEAYARALQDAEEREMAARLLALASLDDGDDEDSDLEDHANNSQDAWEEVDPDELSYEELLALGEVVGTESRGLSADTIALLPSIDYKTGSSHQGSNDSCVICRLDYEDGETLTLLSCKHSYHRECINNWLNINKVCPVCSAEVSTPGNS